MIKQKAKRITMIVYVLAVILLAGCGKDEFSESVTGLTVEDIPAEELPEEEGKEPEGESTQSAAQDTPEDKTAQSAPEESANGTVQETVKDAAQNNMAEGEKKDAESARMEKYQRVLTDVIEKHIYPDGTECGFDESFDDSGNKFAIFDVDKDGKKELILCIASTYMGGMREIIYDYDEKTDNVREEYSGFPVGIFYENGLIEESMSHNQGMAPLGDFWPYMLHRYQAESDSYQCIFTVDAWEKEFRTQDYDGNPYPEETDEEKSGIVYFLMEGGTYDTASTTPVSKSTYEEWKKEQGLGSAVTEIPFQTLMKENVGNKSD